MTIQPDGSVILTKAEAKALIRTAFLGRGVIADRPDLHSSEDAMETARTTYDALLAALWDTETDTTERKRLENWI